MREKWKQKLRPWAMRPRDVLEIEFWITIGVSALMFWVIVGLGDPYVIPGGLLRWHHMVELLAFYCLGAWLARCKRPLLMVLLIYFVEGITTPFIIVPQENYFIMPYIIPFCLWLGLPMIVGFLIHQRYIAERQKRAEKV